MSPSHKVAEVKPLDVTWWRRDSSGEFYTQQDGEARLVKLRNGRKVTGWILYIRGEYRGQWSTLAQAKHRALEISKGQASFNATRATLRNFEDEAERLRATDKTQLSKSALK